MRRDQQTPQRARSGTRARIRIPASEPGFGHSVTESTLATRTALRTLYAALTTCMGGAFFAGDPASGQTGA
jgi:hypothetical protein